jgi:hypothetical protein
MDFDTISSSQIQKVEKSVLKDADRLHGLIEN